MRTSYFERSPRGLLRVRSRPGIHLDRDGRGANDSPDCVFHVSPAREVFDGELSATSGSNFRFGIIQSTRYQAISQGYPFQVVFSTAAGTYQLKSDQDNDGVFVNVGGAIPFGNSSTTLGDRDATLQFSGGGSVKATAGTMVLVLTRSGKTGTITVSNYGNYSIVYAP